MGSVVFDYAAWAARYPEFGQIGSMAAQSYFDEATLYCDNTDTSPVADLAQRALVLGMATAHIAALYGGVNGEAPSPLVGRISSASEGSVSVSVDAGSGGSATQAYWTQTRYGLAWWAATAQYRRGRYVPGPGRPRRYGYGYGFDRTP